VLHPSPAGTLVCPALYVTPAITQAKNKTKYSWKTRLRKTHLLFILQYNMHNEKVYVNISPNLCNSIYHNRQAKMVLICTIRSIASLTMHTRSHSMKRFCC